MELGDIIPFKEQDSVQYVRTQENVLAEQRNKLMEYYSYFSYS